MNAKNTRKSKICQPKSTEPRIQRQPTPIQPILVEYGLYSRDQLISGMAIAGATIDKWVEKGLRPRDKYTKNQFFRGGDVMDAMIRDQSPT